MKKQCSLLFLILLYSSQLLSITNTRAQTDSKIDWPVIGGIVTVSTGVVLLIISAFKQQEKNLNRIIAHNQVDINNLRVKVSDLQAKLNGHIEQTGNNVSTLENRATTLKSAIDTVKADVSKLPTHKDLDLLKKQTTNAQEFNQFMQAYVIELARLHGAIKLLQLSVQRLVAANQPAEISSALVCKLSDDVLEIGRRINRLEGLGLSKSFSSEVSDSEIPNEAPDNETFYMLISTELSN